MTDRNAIERRVRAEIARADAVEQATDLESLLVALSAYGQPWVSQMDRGWYAKIEMHVVKTAGGVTFEVRSEFGHNTPFAAVDEVRHRVLAAIEEATAGAP